MADPVAELSVKLRADTSEFDAAMDRVEERFRAMMEMAEKMEEILNSLGEQR
jgi:hypothetical protein